LPKQLNDPLDEVEFKLTLGQADDCPARQYGFEILLGVLGITQPAAVTATARDEDSALDLDQRPAFEVSEIRPPFPGGVEPNFLLQGRTLGHTPEQEKPGFELGASHLTGQPSQPFDGKLPLHGDGN
jgi:hypothetical protein